MEDIEKGLFLYLSFPPTPQKDSSFPPPGVLHSTATEATGPHRLLEARGENAFQLDIPAHLRISRTRNVAEFKRDQADNSRPQDLPSPVHVTKSGQAMYEVDRIVNWRECEGAAEFEIKWAGCADDGNTWELTNITRYGGKALFQEFVNSTLADDERLRKFLPKPYGGTAPAKRRGRRKAG